MRWQSRGGAGWHGTSEPEGGGVLVRRGNCGSIGRLSTCRETGSISKQGNNGFMLFKKKLIHLVQ